MQRNKKIWPLQRKNAMNRMQSCYSWENQILDLLHKDFKSAI